MENEKKGDTLIIKLILGVIAGIIIGLVSNEQVISVILPIKFFLGELIFFVVPFIIIYGGIIWKKKKKEILW